MKKSLVQKITDESSVSSLWIVSEAGEFGLCVRKYESLSIVGSTKVPCTSLILLDLVNKNRENNSILEFIIRRQYVLK